MNIKIFAVSLMYVLHEVTALLETAVVRLGLSAICVISSLVHYTPDVRLQNILRSFLLRLMTSIFSWGYVDSSGWPMFTTIHSADIAKAGGT